VEVETFREGEVALYRGALPFSSDGVFQLYVDLGPVKRPIAFVDLIWELLVVEDLF